MRTYLMIILFAIINVFSINAEPLISTPVATLNHDGQVTQYYGGNALQAAHNDAVSGDVITLNNGIFNACTITKGITLRGVCMGTTPEMEEQGMRPTVINNTTRIRVPQTETNTLRIEDLCFNDQMYVDYVPHISFTRVMTKKVLYTDNLINRFDAVKCSFYQIIPNAYYAETVYAFLNSTMSFYRMWDAYLPYHVNAENCVMGGFQIYNNSASYDCEFYNCIFTYTSSSSSQLPTNCSTNYCVASNEHFFDNCQANGCQTATMSELYGVQAPNIYYYGDYINPLTETAVTTYLGNDGTQVGIYGGAKPFTMMPDNPFVTKCDIAGVSNEDGKLKIQIEINSAE